MVWRLGKLATPLQPQSHSNPPEREEQNCCHFTEEENQTTHGACDFEKGPQEDRSPIGPVHVHTHSLPPRACSFSVARKSSLPVLICPEGCYYTFRACASQAGRAPQERRGWGGVSSTLFRFFLRVHTRARRNHGPSIPSCHHGWLMPLRASRIGYM